MKKTIKVSEKVNYEDLNVGDKIEVKVGEKVYLSEIDQNKTQRFLPIEPHYSKHKNGEYDLNQLKVDYLQGKITQEDYAELNVGIAYSVSGFCELSSFQDMKIENPLWDTTHPEDVYLFACYEKNKISRDQVIEEIVKRDGISKEAAEEYIEEYI